MTQACSTLTQIAAPVGRALFSVELNQLKLRVSEPSQTVQFKAHHRTNVATFEGDAT